MKRIMLFVVCMCSMYTIMPVDELTLSESLAQTFETLGISKDSALGKSLGVITIAVGLYTFGETAYRRYARWKSSADPKKADFNGFVKRLALDTLTEIGVVTYEEVNQIIQAYLEVHALHLTEEEVREIAAEVAREIVEQQAIKSPARIVVLEKSPEA